MEGLLRSSKIRVCPRKMGKVSKKNLENSQRGFMDEETCLEKILHPETPCNRHECNTQGSTSSLTCFILKRKRFYFSYTN